MHLSLQFNCTPRISMLTITSFSSGSAISGGNFKLYSQGSRTSRTPKLIHCTYSFPRWLQQDRDGSSKTAIALIRTLSRQGDPLEALDIFREFVGRSWKKPSSLPLSAVLQCCIALQAIKSGREVHGFLARNGGDEAGAYRTLSALVCFYAKCGLISLARKVFDSMPMRDVVSWTIILMAYSKGEELRGEVMPLFLDMLCSGILPNPHTLTVTMGCASLREGRQLQTYLAKRGWNCDAFTGSSLIDLYAKNGDLDGAQLIFDRIEHKDVVCYNSLIMGYGRKGLAQNLIFLFNEMSLVGLFPNQSTIVALLNGCASLGLISLARQFHSHALVRGFSSDKVLQGIIIDMYAKCGDLESAIVAFDQMGAVKSTAGWNSMICGFGKHGHAMEAFKLFDAMQLSSFPPDHITFTCLLSACSHSGVLVDEGWKLFNLLHKVYGVSPRKEHYACMADLLGRSGKVKEAYEFISQSNVGLAASVWGSLLAACKVWGDVDIGKIAARKLFEIEPECSGSYVGLASIFSAKERWEDAVLVRSLMDENGVKKDPGQSMIDIGGVLYRFLSGVSDMIDFHEMEELMLACKRLNSNILSFAHNEILLGVEG